MEEFANEGQRQESKQTDIREYWLIVLKRKWTIITFAFAVFALVTLASFLMTPIYTAKGTLAIEREPNILSFEQILQVETFNDDYFQTQYKLLESRSLAEETISRMKLAENAGFTGKALKAGAKGDPAARGKLVNLFLSRLKVNPIRQTRLVEVSYKDPDPKFAADTLNAFFNAFIDMNIQKKFLATEQASEFLTAQIAAVTAEIQRDTKKLQDYGAENNIIALGDKETTVVENLGTLNKALTDAQIERVQKEAYYNEIRGASPDYLPSVINNPLIQRLREDYARLRREYAKNQEILKSEYPEMQRLKSDLDAAKSVLETETRALIKSAYGDFQAALKKEKSLEAAFNEQRQKAVQLNSNSILYNGLKIEIDNKKSLLESLLRRHSETGVSVQLKGLGTSNVWIVDRAETPIYPSSPKKKLNIALALLVGLFGGLGFAFLFERLDNTVKNFEDVEKCTGLPALGIVPALAKDELRKAYGRMDRTKEGGEGGKTGENLPNKNVDNPIPMELVTHLAPRSSYAEFYRSIRTTLLLSAPSAKIQILTVSSALPQEGKTVTISNLGIAFAQMGKRVLLIDADLRKPRLHEIFKIKNFKGLTSYLSNGFEFQRLILPTMIHGLFLINSGPIPPNPAELLGSEKMGAILSELRNHFDFILIDTPPVISVSDAMVLSPKIDGNLLVVWSGRTPRELLRRACAKLNTDKIKCLGVILNKAELQDFGYDYMKTYNKYYGGIEA